MPSLSLPGKAWLGNAGTLALGLAQILPTVAEFLNPHRLQRNRLATSGTGKLSDKGRVLVFQ